MDRDIRLVADHPAVVWVRRNVENVARAKLDHLAAVHRRGGTAGYDPPDMLDRAERLAQRRAHVFGPAPAGLIGRAADGHPADADDLELALGERPHFVRLLEPL